MNKKELFNKVDNFIIQNLLYSPEFTDKDYKEMLDSLYDYRVELVKSKINALKK